MTTSPDVHTRVAVIGAGAVGQLVAALLPDPGAVVTLVSRRQHVVQKVLREGIEIRQAASVDGTLRRSPGASQPQDLPDAAFQVTVLANKANDLEQGLDLAVRITQPDGLIISLQNGLTAATRVEERDQRGVCGVSYLGGTYLAAGVVEMTSTGPIVVAPRAHLHDRVEHLWLPLGDDRLRLVTEPDRDAVLWTKLVNSVVNSVAGALLMPVHELTRSPSAWRVLEAAREEVLAVAAASGVELDTEQVLRPLRDRPTASGIVGSTYQSLMTRRPSEVDDAAGEIERLGRSHGVPTPVNTTLRLLTRTREDLWAVTSPDP